MAAMDQQKLNTMCTQINNSFERYANCISTEATNLVEVFNTNWVSNASKQLFNGIQEVLNHNSNTLSSLFAKVNEGIDYSVYNFNITENENIVYSGISFKASVLSATLNDTLPNGKLGVADGADLNIIKEPIDKLVGETVEELDNIKKTVINCDAFSDAEQEALISGVEKQKSIFINDMNAVKDAVSKCMAQEVSDHADLDRANIGNLGA